MKKFQVIKCKTCGTVFSACINEYADADWYKQCARYIANGNSIVETIETDGNVFGDEPLNKCCGKKMKEVRS
jgi:hypothetical protein